MRSYALARSALPVLGPVERLHQIQAQIAAIEAAQRQRLKQAPGVGLRATI